MSVRDDYYNAVQSLQTNCRKLMSDVNDLAGFISGDELYTQERSMLTNIQAEAVALDAQAAAITVPGGA